jgi:sugar/nucleoside kinase (ribokinase family)
MFDVCAVGHVTRDVIRIQGRAEREQPGGAAYYAAMALASLGLKAAVVTRMALRDEDALLSGLRAAGVTVFCRASRSTTFFENTYPEGASGGRVLRPGAVAGALSARDLEGVRARGFLLDPLTHAHAFAAFLKAVRPRAGLVALEAQGLVRKLFCAGVPAAVRQRALRGLDAVDILKADEDEARALTGAGDAATAARLLGALGPREVVVTRAGRGALVWARGRVVPIPAMAPARAVDATGCGDTFLAGYLARRLETEDPQECGRFAAALAALKLSGYGPFTGTRQDVERMLARASAFPQ